MELLPPCQFVEQRLQRLKYIYEYIQHYYLAPVPGEGRTGCALRSSSGPTSFVFNLISGRPYPAHRLQALLPPPPLFVCFSRGGLGVGDS